MVNVDSYFFTSLGLFDFEDLKRIGFKWYIGDHENALNLSIQSDVCPLDCTDYSIRFKKSNNLQLKVASGNIVDVHSDSTIPVIRNYKYEKVYAHNLTKDDYCIVHNNLFSIFGKSDMLNQACVFNARDFYKFSSLPKTVLHGTRNTCLVFLQNLLLIYSHVAEDGNCVKISNCESFNVLLQIKLLFSNFGVQCSIDGECLFIHGSKNLTALKEVFKIPIVTNSTKSTFLNLAHESLSERIKRFGDDRTRFFDICNQHKCFYAPVLSVKETNTPTRYIDFSFKNDTNTYYANGILICG